MTWRKCLHLEQSYPINYIEIEKTRKKRNLDETHEDINRAVIRMSIVALNFCLFRLMMLEEMGISKPSWFSFVILFTESFLESRRGMGVCLRPGFLLLVFAYLISPLIRTMTIDMCSQTVYMYFAATQVFFVIDSVSASIYNNSAPVEIKDASVPLSLEESINIPKQLFSNQILGLTSYFLGFILLSSRLSSSASVFNLLCLTFMGYIILPKYTERLCIHKNRSAMMLICVSASVANFLVSIRIFCIYNCAVVSLYSIAHISIRLLEQDLRNKACN